MVGTSAPGRKPLWGNSNSKGHEKTAGESKLALLGGSRFYVLFGLSARQCALHWRILQFSLCGISKLLSFSAGRILGRETCCLGVFQDKENALPVWKHLQNSSAVV